nr:MAG: RNA-dependent RNA polymerase [Riboviria sp.]
MLKGRIGLLNKHVQMKKDQTQWRIINQSGNCYEFNLWNCASAQFSADDGDDYFRDLFIVELPRFVHQHVDITGKFMTSEDFSRFKTLSQVCLFSYDAVTDNVKYLFSNTCDAFDQDFGLKWNGTRIGAIRKYFMYGIQTARGDCGGLLCAYDQAFSRKLIGIHAAGSTHPMYQGVGQPVTQQVLNKLFERLCLRKADSAMSPDVEHLIKNDIRVTVENGMLQSNLESNFVHFGEAHTSIHHPTKSNIHPSPLHSIIATPTMKPANLHPVEVNGLRVNPMTLARSKASFAPTEPEEKLLNSCTNDYSNFVNSHPTVYNKIFTLEESIRGIEGDDFLDGVNRRTSPGFGFKAQGPGKTHWLGTDEYITDHPEIVKAHAEMLECCQSGKRPTVLWIDTLKDEKRPIPKVDEGKTRLFSVGEMVYTLLFRQYFLGFAAHMMKNRIDLESCIGTNVYNRDWTRIADKISALGPNVIAGDFSNYDGSMNASMLWKVLEVIEAFYKTSPNWKPEDEIVRMALWSEIVNSIHIYESTIYGWTHSNPSGCALTAILNSVYHSICARYVYLVCARKFSPSHFSLDMYYKVIRHINYGDDDVWNLSPEIIEWFNQITITEAFALIGMTYTDEAKTGNIVPVRRLDEIEFLKRKFRWDPVQSRYRAPLSLTTIKEMAMWVRGTVDVHQLTCSTLEDAVHELAQHDRETFETELPKFKLAQQKLAPRVLAKIHDYDHYQEMEHLKWCDVNFQTPTIEVEMCGEVQMDDDALNVGSSISNRYTNVPEGMCIDTSFFDASVRSCKPGSQCITMDKQQQQQQQRREDSQRWGDINEWGSPTGKYQTEWDYTNWLVSELAHHKVKLNEQIGNDESAHFMMDFYARMQKDLRAYRLQLNNYLAQVRHAEDEGLRSRLERMCYGDDDVRVILSEDFGEIQMDGETNTDEMLEGKSETIKRQIVEFKEDAPVVSAHMKYSKDYQGYDNMASDTLENSIVGILQRPLVLSKGSWSPSATVGTTIWTTELPKNWFSLGTNIVKKLDGFRYLRADFRITMQINHQPFNAGCLLMYFVPFESQLASPPSSMDADHFGGLTGYKPVFFDLSSATTAEMVVPFMCPESHFDLITGSGLLGTVHCVVYSKLTGGDNDVEYTVYCSAENIHLEMPTGMPIFNYGEVQMDDGPSMPSAFSEPVLRPLSASMNWATDVISGASEFLGFSKKRDAKEVETVQIVNSRYLNNFDGDSKGKNLGLSSRNTVSTPAGHFQTTDDEMNLAHIIGKPVYLSRFPMTVAQVADVGLWSVPVTPYICNSTTTAGVNTRFNTYLSYLSPMFMFIGER